MKILFVTLGCDKNYVDSEKIIGFLNAGGHELTDDESVAEVAVINTCCFIHDAKDESIENIIGLGALKSSAVLKYLIVLGCLGERYSEQIMKAIPEVDAVLGTTAYDELNDVIDRLSKGEKFSRPVQKDINYDPVIAGDRKRSDINHYSYLKIAEGCDKHCTYCVIPKLKGNYRSLEFDSLIKEAEWLAETGVTELMIVAQETTLYGTDLYGKKRLPELLKKLCRIEGLKLIRLMYCYPEEITDELIEVMATEPKICHYIDMPMQHASDNVLKRMGRRTNRAEITDIINRLRERIPDICIRTSLIAGFPGETEADHEELCEFLETMKLDRVGVFTYSREEGTPADKLPNQVHHSTKSRRRRQLMELQQAIVIEKNQALVGTRMKVVIDGRLPENDVYVGRTYMDAPGIDSYVFVETSYDLMSGAYVEVEITGTDTYDLVGRVAED